MLSRRRLSCTNLSCSLCQHRHSTVHALTRNHMQLYITAKQLGLINGVVVLTHTHTHLVVNPTRRKIGHFRDVSRGQSLGLVRKKLNITQKNRAFTNQKNYTRTQNNHKKTKLVAFCDIQPRNGAGLFSKEKICKGGDE